MCPYLLHYETVSPRNMVFHVCCVLGDLDLAPSVSQFGVEDDGQVKIFHTSTGKLKGPSKVIY